MALSATFQKKRDAMKAVEAATAGWSYTSTGTGGTITAQPPVWTVWLS